MSSAKFAGELFAWLRVISRDHEVPAAGMRVAMEMSQHMNEGTREAFPGHESLAKHIGADPRTVRRLIDRLVARGHLVIVEHRRSKYGTVIYRLPDRQTSVSSDDDGSTGQKRPVRPLRERTSVSGESGHQCPVADQVDRTSVAARPDIFIPLTGHFHPADRTPMSDKPFIEPSQNTSHEPSQREGARKRARSRTNATRLPADWSPTDAEIDYALEKGLTVPEADREAEQFRDYHLSHGTTRTDWAAAWRMWVRKGIEFRKPTSTTGAGSPGRNSSAPIAEAMLRTVGMTRRPS